MEVGGVDVGEMLLCIYGDEIVGDVGEDGVYVMFVVVYVGE